MISTTNP
ncbi:hypothetical protein OXX79_013996, partial [Metschnikowia pulcherrima]